MIGPREEQELVGGGDTRLHYHLEDRVPTHQTLVGLQGVTHVSEKNANYTVTDQDDILLVDTTSGDVTIQLLRARGGRELIVTKIAAPYAAIIVPDGTETICGDTSMLLDMQWTSVRLKAITDGWILI